MTPDRWKQVQEVFEEAYERPEDERAAYLDGACSDDPDLRREVESLLAVADIAELPPPQISMVAGQLLREATVHPVVGSTLDGKYRIDAKLGQGGMGAVYRATHLQLERSVAVKLLETGPRSHEHDPAALDRFKREALAVARIKHPNIVTIHDFGVVPGVGAYLVMEHLEGRSLYAHLAERGRLSVAEARTILGQVLSAMETAHRAGVIHRDLKPDNIFLEESADGPRAKVLDFGIAKLRDASGAADARLTRTGAVIGTPTYMSPEQCSGDDLDERSDVYSAGCVLYEMLTGRPPFLADRIETVLFKHIREAPLPPSSVAPDLPAGLDPVVLRALAKEPDARYRTAKQFALALEHWDRTGSTIMADGAVGAGNSDTTGLRSKADSSTPHNLSFPTTEFVGREERVAAVRREFATTRLLTLTGPGGTGKSRLALEAAKAMIGEFPGGVYVVELAAIVDPDLVPSAIATTLGVKEEGAMPLLERLLRSIGDRQMLLVLDNFEQVLDAAPVVTRLLVGTPYVKLLVTSRARLRVRAEREFEVAPLEVPPPGPLPPVDELTAYAAIELFVDRARQAAPDFVLTDRNAEAVVEICRRLDGLPLALELACARLKVLEPRELLARLGDRLKLLRGGPRDLPERQQTMRGTIAWSYDLLDEGERALFRRLAVFSGGVTLEAAEAVAAGEDRDVEVLDGVASLVDKSLLRRREGAGRFMMLETIREYGLECLEASGEAEAVRRRHAAFFVALAERVEPELRGGDAPLWLDRLAQEHDNFRVAFAWALGNESAMALRLAAALRNFLHFHGHYTEGIAWLESALERASREPSVARVNALAGLGALLVDIRDIGRARSNLEESIRVAEQLGEKALILRALSNVASTFAHEGDYAAARTKWEETLDLAVEVEDRYHIAQTLNNLGEASRALGDLDSARTWYEAAVAAGREVGEHPYLVAIPLINLGIVNDAMERFDEALASHREGLALSQKLSHRKWIALAMVGIASVFAGQQRFDRAARLLGAAQAIFDETGTQLDLTDQDVEEHARELARTGLGDVAFETCFAEGRALTLDKAIAIAAGAEPDD